MKINDVEVVLLDNDISGCTRIQADVYNLLILLNQAGVKDCSAKAISNYIGLSSSLPLWSRLRHLEEQGMIRLLQPAIAV
jgi:hypothetical protein